MFYTISTEQYLFKNNNGFVFTDCLNKQYLLEIFKNKELCNSKYSNNVL